MNICINGFGRIGRQLTRILAKRGMQVTCINDPNLTTEEKAYLLKHDSEYGKFALPITTKSNVLTIGRATIICAEESQLDHIPLRTEKILIDASPGTSINQYRKILQKTGIDYVFLTHYNTEADVTIVNGFNDQIIKDVKRKSIIALATCDATAMLPLLKLIPREEITHISILSLHPFLPSQQLLDGKNHDTKGQKTLLRATHGNLIPKTTSAGTICSQMLGIMNIYSYQLRVPTASVSCAFIDIDVNDHYTSSLKKILLRQKKNILAFNTEDLVSQDFKGTSVAATIDFRRTSLEKNKLKFLLWYDNEYGYSFQVSEIVRKFILTHGKKK